MKQLAAMTMIVLVSLCSVNSLWADTASRSFGTQAATPAIPSPPAPVVVEAVNGELNLTALGNADATVELTYPEIADGNTAGLFWTSGNQQYRAPVQTVKDGAKRLIFRIPNATVVKDLGQSPKLTASVGVNGQKLVISRALILKVVQTATPGAYSAPTLPGLAGNEVDVGTLAGDLNVTVNYPGLNNGQSVKALWKGATSYDTQAKIAQNGSPLQFIIPKETVLASLGKPVTLSYEVTEGGQSQASTPLHPAVKLDTLSAVPVAPAAVQGKLDLKTLKGAPVTITYIYPGIAAGHAVGIRWTGDPVYDTPHPAIGATPRPLAFSIPYDKVEKEKGKKVEVTASVSINNRPLLISPKLTLDVVDTTPNGVAMAVALNTRFNDTRAACDNNTPAYYCNGITLRTTQNGSYDPWNASPLAKRIGAISFSYMRKDANVSTLYHDSGFIFLPQQQAIKQGKQLDYLCIYAYDAWTDRPNRPDNGCGLQPRNAISLKDPSTCASAKAVTETTWYAHASKLSHVMYQCSFSTQVAEQFNTSIKVRGKRPANFPEAWNEILIKLWPDNTPAQLPMEAFFYKNAAGLPEARAYQTKFKARTGSWLPIIKLDMTQLNGNPFSYSAADQAEQP